MRIIVEAQGEIKIIKGEDFVELIEVLEKIRNKYQIDIEIHNFDIDMSKIPAKLANP